MNIKVNTKNVFYVKKGTSDRVLLLVHGWGSSSKNLESLQDLVSKDFTTIALDLPGFGGSDMPDVDWGVSEYSSFVVAFLKALGIDKCTYLGHSFGGALGVYIAANFSEVVDRLILCAPSFRRISIEGKTEQKMANAYKKLHLPESRKLKEIYYRVFFPDSELLKFPKLETNFRKIVSEDLTPFINKISQKTLIIWGDLDTYVPISYGHMLHDGINNSAFIEYKGYGHKLPYTEASRVYKDIKEFMIV